MSRKPCAVDGCNVGASREGFCGSHAPDRPLREVLPMAPLVALVEGRGGLTRFVDTASSTARNYYQAKKLGTVTPFRADRLAHEVLGLHPCEVWGEWFGPYGVSV